jgi:hypothetical protein
MMNCVFPFKKILETDLVPETVKADKVSLERAFTDSKANVITFLQHVSLLKSRQASTQKIDTHLLWHKHVDKLLYALKSESNQFIAIQSIRDTVYKIYHVGIPLKDVCHHVIRTISSMYNSTETEHEPEDKPATKKKATKKSSKATSKIGNTIMNDVVTICATCEHDGLGNKNILSYERLFCEIYRLMIMLV